MAYTPSEWSCGDIVTADKLNNIERGIAEVNSEYVPTSWQCGDLITAEAMNKIEQGIANADGGGCTWVELTDETITTAAGQLGNQGTFSYAQLVDAETIRVTFDGTQYECSRIDMSSTMYAYGGVGQDAFDFSQYPFAIISNSTSSGYRTELCTENAGTYTVKIEEQQCADECDFTIANVLVIPGGSTSESMASPRTLIVDNDHLIMGEITPTSIRTTYSVVLYKGEATMNLYGSGTNPITNMSGAITQEDEYTYIITGDCTLNMKLQAVQ